MGGTFDPIHYGHLLIAENAAQQYNLSKVWFMPTGYSPHKNDSEITEAKHRCEMIRLAIADHPTFSISFPELETEKTSYTYRTLEGLNEKYPEVDFYFILGGDSLQDFETWKYPERVLKAAYILAAIREEIEGNIFQQQIEYLIKKYGAKGIYPLETPSLEISSSNIRKMVQEQKTIRYLLPETVRNYILQHKLYLDKV